MNLSYSGENAFQITRANPMRAWHGDGPNTAQTRLSNNDYVPINHKPRFSLDLAEPVFTIGSCFARNVEAILQRLGVPLVTEGHGVEVRYLASWSDSNAATDDRKPNDVTRGALNKYSVHSMTHDIRRALLDEGYVNVGLIEVSPGKWFDPHASALKLTSFDEASENRRRLDLAMKQVRKAKVVFITLGLTESWMDTETGLVMNAHPGAQFFKKFGTRFQFIDYGFQDILEEIRKFVALIRNQCIPDMKFICTVSPVPLGATFRDVDVIVANTASKSTLRAVAEQLCREDQMVDYFPSYEMVVNSPRALAWEADQLHVRSSMVAHIMSTFKRVYYGVE